MSPGLIFAAVPQLKRKVRRASWQLHYRAAQVLPNVLLILFLYFLFVVLFLVSAASVTMEQLAGVIAAFKTVAAKLVSGSSC